MVSCGQIPCSHENLPTRNHEGSAILWAKGAAKQRKASKMRFYEWRVWTVNITYDCRAGKFPYTAAIFQSVFSSYNKLRSSPDRRGTYQLSSGSSLSLIHICTVYRNCAYPASGNSCRLRSALRLSAHPCRTVFHCAAVLPSSNLPSAKMRWETL